jgi:hypothetical protein
MPKEAKPVGSEHRGAALQCAPYGLLASFYCVMTSNQALSSIVSFSHVRGVFKLAARFRTPLPSACTSGREQPF